MEELKKRLDFQNVIVQTQAVDKLVAEVLKEVKGTGVIDKTSHENPALQLLWERACGGDVLVRSCCCQALVALARSGVADPTYVLNTFLNMVPSASHLHGVVSSLGELLLLPVRQLLAKDPGCTHFKSPFTIRSRPHPYISVLTNRPDSWPVLLQNISTMLCTQEESLTGFVVAALEPFVRFVLCEPDEGHANATLRLGLLQALLQTEGIGGGRRRPTHRHALLLLHNLVPHLQAWDPARLCECQLIMEFLARAMLKQPELWQSQLPQMALQLLCLAELVLRITGDCQTVVSLLQAIQATVPESFPHQQVLAGISLLLLLSPASQSEVAMLSLVESVLCRGDACGPVTTVLLMPLLHIASSAPRASTGLDCQACAAQLLDKLERLQEDRTGYTQECELDFPLTGWYAVVRSVWRAVLRFSLDAGQAERHWLQAVRGSLLVQDRVPLHVTLLVSFLLATSGKEHLQEVLVGCSSLARADPTQAPYLIPVLMYRLGKPLEPEIYHSLLYSLPTLGTHKACVAQVLRTVRLLGTYPLMRPVALRLLSKLWQTQDRVYPELQKAMAALDGKAGTLGCEGLWDCVLSRAATVRDICRSRPYQHGADMVAAVSRLLDECRSDEQASAAALAVQGLYALCDAEVVDVHSAWSALSSRLLADRRPLVLKNLSELFALVPFLAIKTPEYERFQADVLNLLWSYSQDQDAVTAGAAYRALAAFSPTQHTVLHLPEQVRPERQVTAEEEGEQEVDLTVPGDSYIKLLLLIPAQVLTVCVPVPQDAGELLKALVEHELSVMPRGVQHAAMRGAASRLAHGKPGAAVPAFMLRSYEKNKQPGLRPGLAAGLLLSYDLPMQVDKEGRPVARFLVSRGRSFQQMLSALIQEVPVQPSEWHRSVLLPLGWQGFVERTYHAVLQGRLGELEIQQRQGKEDPQELQYRQFLAWIWARDTLTEVLKSAAKESPVVQANTILALASLAATVVKHENSLPSRPEDSTQIGADILPTQTWLEMVLETLLSVVDGGYLPKGRTYNWFHQRTQSRENTCSALARSCAALALSLLVPALAMSLKDGVARALEVLIRALPGAPGADETPVLLFHCGLALGLFLARLHEERLAEVSEQKLSLLLMRALDSLETSCFQPQLEHTAGCVLGLGLVLSVMSQSSQTESHVHVRATRDKLMAAVAAACEQTGRQQQEALGYAVACVTVAAFNSGILQASEAEQAVNQLRILVEQNQQSAGFALALGVVVCGLASCGHGCADELCTRLMAAWTKILHAEGCPTTQRLAAASGLAALSGSESPLIALKTDVLESPQCQARLGGAIKSLTQVVSASDAVGLQSNAAWLLGHLYLSSSATMHGRASVPPDFDYLPSSSVIKAATAFLIEAGRRGPEAVSASLVAVVLGALAAAASNHQFPPVNWPGLLTPLLRLAFGEVVQHLAIQLAVAQANASQSASVFLAVWVAAPLLHSLAPCTRSFLCSSLPLWMRHVPQDKMEAFLDSACTQAGGDQLALLQGLRDALRLPNLPHYCWSALSAATERAYVDLPVEIQECRLEEYQLMAHCLSQLPDADIDRITHVGTEGLLKATLLRVLLVAEGRVPLVGLNDSINCAVGHPQHRAVLWLLLQGLHQARFTQHEHTGVQNRLEWLLELMGHVRNTAAGPDTEGNATQQQAVELLLRVFAAAALAWADLSSCLLAAASPCWGPDTTTTEEPPGPGAAPLGSPGLALGSRDEDGLTVEDCLRLMPLTLPQLMQKEPWKQQADTFIEWLVAIDESPAGTMTAATRTHVTACLLSLRTLPAYRKLSVWTRAYHW
ncbi:focadhesin isoform X2 [Petromyzon marinus]|uniref:focadhesin isoform X2 n=1 Tax=Petromyzon marinus TaxID=7757 RepID=UPI003F72CAA0